MERALACRAEFLYRERSRVRSLLELLLKRFFRALEGLVWPFKLLGEENVMPSAIISLMDESERKRVMKQMDDVVKLLRQNTAQVTKLATAMDKLVKAMG